MSAANEPDATDQGRDEDDRPPYEHVPAHGQDTSPGTTLSLYADSLALAALLRPIESQVIAGLRRRGIEADDARDAFQDALVRLCRHRPAFSDRAALARWLSLVSYRAAEKARVRNARLVLDELFVRRATTDPGEHAEARLALDALARELRAMRPTDRQVLVASLNGNATRTLDGHERVRLHRARRRLRARFRGWLAGIPAHRLLARRRAGVDTPATAGIGLTVAVAAGLVASVTGGVTAAREAPRRVEPLVVLAPRPTTTAEPATPSTGPSQVGGVRHPDPAPIRDDVRVAPPTPDRWVIATGPADTAAGTSTRSPEDNSVVCYGNLPLVEDRCIEHPLRDK